MYNLRLSKGAHDVEYVNMWQTWNKEHLGKSRSLSLFSHKSNSAQFELSFEWQYLHVGVRVYGKLHSDAWFELHNSNDGPDRC